MTIQEVTTLFGSIDASAAAQETLRAGRLASRQQNYEKALLYYNNALEFVGTSTLFKARAHEYLGEVHWMLGDYDKAEAAYSFSLQASADPEQISRACVGLGEVADFRGEYDKAEMLFTQALEGGTAVNNLIVIGRAHRGLGIINRRTGKTQQAVSHLSQALVAFQQAGASTDHGRTLTSLGRTRHARGEYQLAISAHEEALHLFESLGDQWRIIQSLNDLGECYQALYDIERALANHKRALDLIEEHRADLIRPTIERNLGVDLIARGQHDEGMTYLKKALATDRQTGDREEEALALYQIAHAYIHHGDIDSGAEYVAELHFVAEILDVDRYRALASFVHGELLFYQGNQKEAIEELNAAMLAAQTSVDRGVLWKLHAAISNVVDDEAIASVHRTIAADFICQTAEPLQDPSLRESFINAPPVLAVLHMAGIDPEKLQPIV